MGSDLRTPLVTASREQRQRLDAVVLVSVFNNPLRLRQGLPLVLETVLVVGGSLGVGMTPV